jgi:hypothetical protein
VATDLSRDELRRLARLGAERRLEDLEREAAAIRAAFPELAGGQRGRAGRRGRPAGRAAASAAGAETATASGAQAGAAKRRRRRKPMTAAQKRAVSERMKKYWAGRRKANG